MSKLISKFVRISRGSPAPMGFGHAARPPKTPAMAFIGLLSQNYKRGATRLTRLEADGALLQGVNPDRELSDIAEALGEVPWGLKAGEMDGDSVENLVERGCDFFLVSPDKVTIEAVKDDRAAFLLDLPPGVDDSFLRAIEDLPISAVFMSLGPVGSPLNLQHLINIGSVRTMFDKYLLVEVPNTVSAKELEGLRDMGVDAVVVDAGQSSEKVLRGIKQNLLDMPRQPKPRLERTTPMLAAGLRASADHADEENEEDEEE